MHECQRLQVQSPAHSRWNVLSWLRRCFNARHVLELKLACTGVAYTPDDVNKNSRLFASPPVQVWLRAKRESNSVPVLEGPGPPLVYACSWWHEGTFRAAMRSEAAPIWRNLAAARIEAYRDLCDVYLGDNAALEAQFGTPGPFWGRHYVLYAGGQPLTVVYEVFGPSLATWLGDSDGRAAAAAGS